MNSFQDDPQLRSYLLMEKINPPKVPAHLVRECSLLSTESLSELGVYSVVLTRNIPDGNELLENKTIGTLLRTKNSKSNEGGVVCGVSAVDSPLVLPASAIADRSKDCPKGSIVGAVQL